MQKKIILITGIEGFIGSNIAKFLLEKDDKVFIIGCGSLNRKEKLENINSIRLLDYWDKSELFKNLESLDYADLKYIIHMGACSSTDEWDGKYLIENNTRFSNKLIDYAIRNNIKMVHSSSASVYGLKGRFSEEDNGKLFPLNMYAYSKLLTDNYLQVRYPKQKLITALRFFNVYGKNERHKYGMASPVHTFNEQARMNSEIRLFNEQNPESLFKRDFIAVEEIVSLIFEVLKNDNCYGVFDAGTANPISFNKIAYLIKNYWDENGKNINIKEIDFPDKLKGYYQSYTCADMNYIALKNLNWEANQPEVNIRRFLSSYNKLK